VVKGHDFISDAIFSRLAIIYLLIFFAGVVDERHDLAS
jgi:hypothetical protein